MRSGHLAELLLGFRQRDVQDRLAALHAFQQELQRKRGLAGARHALDQVQPVRCKPPAQDVIETFDARRGPCLGCGAAGRGREPRMKLPPFGYRLGGRHGRCCSRKTDLIIAPFHGTGRSLALLVVMFTQLREVSRGDLTRRRER